jgi:hypothetical protein
MIKSVFTLGLATSIVLAVAASAAGQLPQTESLRRVSLLAAANAGFTVDDKRSAQSEASRHLASSRVRPEIKGALIGIAAGVAVGLVLNRTLNDGDRSVSSYVRSAAILGATGALFGYVGGWKLGQSPFRSGVVVAPVVLPNVIGVAGHVRLH